MERNDRDRYYRSSYNNDDDNYNRNQYDRDNRYDYDYDRTSRYDNDYERNDRDDRSGRRLKQQFEREYQSHHDNDRSSRDRFSDNDRFSDKDRYNDYRSRDYDMERNYYDNTRGDRGTLGDIRQGYGISSFTGTSDRYNRFSEMERERNNQFEQGYGTGRTGGYSGSAFGGANYSAHGGFGGSSDYGSMSGDRGNVDDLTSSSGYGYSSSSYSDRGQPDYSMRDFGGDYGAGSGSTYGGSSYSDDTDYSRDNDRNSSDRGSYGSSSSGNNDRYDSDNDNDVYGFRGTTYGYSGNSGYGIYNERYSSDSDRGGYINRDRNRDY